MSLLSLSNSYYEQNSSSWCLKNSGEAALDMSDHPDLFSCWQTETLPTNTDTPLTPVNPRVQHEVVGYSSIQFDSYSTH